MGFVDTGAMRVVLGTEGHEAGAIYVVDSPEHPFALDVESLQLASAVIMVPVRDWDAALTPWPAKSPFRGRPDFGGEAKATLSELLEALPAIEAAAGLAPKARAICGYSLGGLFSLFALTHADAFCACGCLSGSVWYEGWVDYLRDLEFDGRNAFAYFSVGTKEKRAAQPAIKRVEDDMRACIEIMQAKGCVTEFATSPGGHMSDIDGRLARGLQALDGALSKLGC